MNNELGDQAELLNDLDREMDTADTRMQMVMKKIAKVMHMTSGKSQFYLIMKMLKKRLTKKLRKYSVLLSFFGDEFHLSIQLRIIYRLTNFAPQL